MTGGAAASAREGFRANLARRVATAAVALPALLAAIFLGPPLLFVGIVAAAAAAGLAEFHALLEARGIRPFRAAGFLLLAAVFAQVTFRAGPTLWPLAALLVLTAALAGRGDLAAKVPSAAATLLGVVYLGGLGGTLAALRVMPPSDAGPWRVVLLLAAIMVGDSFAFFAGHAFGRRKLAPSVSPGKTVEGAVAGLLGGVVAALAVRALGLASLSAAEAALLGAAVMALGTVGDLAESVLKRWAGVKDSGALFPGHGGMLDRLDSLLFGAPVLYYYFLYGR